MDAATDMLLHWLTRTSLEASLLIAVVFGLRALLGRRLSPAWRIALWLLVGAKLLLPACIPAGFGLGAWTLATEPPAVEVSLTPASPAVLRLSTAFRPDGVPETSWRFSPQAALLGLWLTGAGTVLAAALRRQRRFNALLAQRPQARTPALLALVARLAAQAGVVRPVGVLLMPAGTTPAVVGLRTPQLLLPADWAARLDEASLRHVVLHELQHVHHRDLLWNWLALGVQALHWFNPLVWLAVAGFQADRELRGDAGALAQLPARERLDYGRTLLRIQASFLAPPATAGLAPCVRHHPALRQRLTMIATPTPRQPWLQALLLLTLGVLASYTFTTARAEEPRRDPDRPRDGEVARTGPRDGDQPKTGPRDGEVARTGPRDGDQPKTGPRDGDVARTGPRDGDQPKTGPRDGDQPRTGPRDGDQPKTGPRESDAPGRRPEAAAKPGRAAEAAPAADGEVLTLQVQRGGDVVKIGRDRVPMNRLRGYLQAHLPEHSGARVEIRGDRNVPQQALHAVLDAVRDNGARNAAILTE